MFDVLSYFIYTTYTLISTLQLDCDLSEEEVKTSRNDEEILTSLPNSAELTNCSSSKETATTEHEEALDEGNKNPEKEKGVDNDDVSMRTIKIN